MLQRRDTRLGGDHATAYTCLTSDARRQALPAAYDAMVGYVARDLLTAEEFDFLTAPWHEISDGRTTGRSG